MRTSDHKEPRPGQVHRDTAREAGLGTVSPLSVIAGTMCAYGTFTIVAAIAGGLLSNTDISTDFRTNDWTSSGAAAGAVTAIVLLIAYLFGGYVAGRMARRAAVVHGIAVFVLSLLMGAIVGAVASLADGVSVGENLRSIGVPTEWDQVESVGVAAAIVSLAAMLLGAIGGGILGERWHTKLLTRFEDPEVGPAAEARARAAEEDEAHERRRDADRTLAMETDRREDERREAERRHAERLQREAHEDRDGDRDVSRDGDRAPETIDLRDRAPSGDRYVTERDLDARMREREMAERNPSQGRRDR